MWSKIEDESCVASSIFLAWTKAFVLGEHQQHFART